MKGLLRREAPLNDKEGEPRNDRGGNKGEEIWPAAAEDCFVATLLSMTRKGGSYFTASKLSGKVIFYVVQTLCRLLGTGL